ncbi:hypothetical protein Anas_13752, partial [Armadillidium nasatum]
FHIGNFQTRKNIVKIGKSGTFRLRNVDRSYFEEKKWFKHKVMGRLQSKTKFTIENKEKKIENYTYEIDEQIEVVAKILQNRKEYYNLRRTLGLFQLKNHPNGVFIKSRTVLLTLSTLCLPCNETACIDLKEDDCRYGIGLGLCNCCEECL